MRDLISGCAVIACDFHDALLERWIGGIDRHAIKAKALQEATEATEPDEDSRLIKVAQTKSNPIKSCQIKVAGLSY